MSKAVRIGAGMCMLVLACVSCDRSDTPPPVEERTTLTVLTRNNAHSYYNYRDTVMGFEYDLAKAFADEHGWELIIKTPPWSDVVGQLERGEGDLIAASMTVLPFRRKRVLFCDSYLDVQQHLIAPRDRADVTALKDLEGEIIHVRSGTNYLQRLEQIKANGLDITIEAVNNVSTEDLMRQVAEGEIGFTVADTNVALLNRRYYPNVRMAFPISPPQQLAWAVQLEDAQLRKQVNAFLKKIRKNGTFDRLYDTYYASVETFNPIDLAKFHKRLHTHLPKYVETLTQECSRYDFDWRLVAAKMYQESHFDPRAKSYTGVRGLMQLTLPTAKQMGVESRLDPVQSIQGGVKYLNWLHERVDWAEGRDRMLITMAAYNVGLGHVKDAKALAEDRNLDPARWSDLAQVLPLLSDPKVYKETKYGYARGEEPVRHIERILVFYDVLKRQVLKKVDD